MHRNHRLPAIGMLHDMMTSMHPHQHESVPYQTLHQLFAGEPWQTWHELDHHTLNADKLRLLRHDASDTQTGLNRFAHTLHQRVISLRLRVAARNLRHTGDEPAFFVTLDDDVEIAGLLFHLATLGRGLHIASAAVIPSDSTQTLCDIVLAVAP